MRALVVGCIVAVFMPQYWAGEAARANEAAARETVLDKVEHIEKEVILDLPPVPKLCDSVTAEKGPVDIGDCDLYCEREGEGTPIVLLHGGPGATHHYFHPHFSRAAEWARVIYYDQRGCGDSDYEPGAAYSIDQAVDDLDALRNALGFEQWVVLAHSYGGTLAQCYSVKYPERVLVLVLVGSASYGLGVGSLGSREYTYITEAERKRIQEIHADASLSQAQMVFNSHLNGDWKRQNFYRPSREQLAQVALYEWKHDPRFRRAVSRSLNTLDLQGAFEDCPLPILIVEGKWDLTWGPKKPSFLQECFPGSELVVLDHAGHSPFADAPDEFFPALKTFIMDSPKPNVEAVSQWKKRLGVLESSRKQSPNYLLDTMGWGRKSSESLAEKYSKDWLEQVNEPRRLLRLGFALYDAKHYEDALDIFRTMADRSGPDGLFAGVALVWQGHMLDLLEEREQAIAVYEKVVAMNATDVMQHDQYGLTYAPSKYAAERLTTPFVRVENSYPD